MFFLGVNATQTFVAALRDIGNIESLMFPSVYCDEVVQQIENAGFACSFYDLDSELNPDFKRVRARADAIVMVNYFGLPSSVKAFQEETAVRGALLVDDNALGYGSADHRGFLGLNADIGIFSPRKTFNSEHGGFAVVGATDRTHLPTNSDWEIPRRGAVLRRLLKANLGYAPSEAPMIASFFRGAIANERSTNGSVKRNSDSDAALKNVKRIADVSGLCVTGMAQKLNTTMRQAIFSSVTTISTDMGAPPVISQLEHPDIVPSALFWETRYADTVSKVSKLLSVPTYSWPTLPSAALELKTARNFIVMPINPAFWPEI